MKFYPWSADEKKRIEKLNSPEKIQSFLDRARYNLEGTPRIPSEVLRQKCAHCFDGALFAASVFAFYGEPPLILDLCAERDDDHILAIFKQGRYLGAVAKSNYVGLRYREPIFKNARELVLSYFESYFNLRREKSLREYSEPFDLRNIKKIDWASESEVFELIARKLIRAPHTKLMTTQQIQRLCRVDGRTFAAGLVGRLENKNR